MTITEDSFERLCPECGERLNRDARRCACGWGARREKSGRTFDMRCTFKAGAERCAYPVGMFPEGATSGWCIFHRNADPSHGGEIVRQSRSVPYRVAIEEIRRRNADNRNVRETRARMAGKPSGDLQQVTANLPPMREPGMDEGEAREASG